MTQQHTTDERRELQARDARIADLEASLWGLLFLAAGFQADLARTDEWTSGAGRCRTIVRHKDGVAECSHLAVHAVCWSDRRRDCCEEHLLDSLRIARMDRSDATDHPLVDGNLWQNHPKFAEIEPQVQEAVKRHEYR